MGKIVFIEQGTQEWLELRKNKITASNYDAIMAGSIVGDKFNPNAAFGDTAKKYAMKKALERTTNNLIEEVKTYDMKRGNELEPLARVGYELETFETVLPGGIAYNKNYLASSDGLIKGQKGGVEFKSVKYNTHFKRLIAGGYDKTYKWQIVGNMWLYKLDWIDFCQYCHEFPEEKQIYIHRVHKNLDDIEKLIRRLTVFNQEIEKYVKIAA
ncbi:YqaJ viral recombinase family protein [Galbibacter sp. BG1]